MELAAVQLMSISTKFDGVILQVNDTNQTELHVSARWWSQVAELRSMNLFSALLFKKNRKKEASYSDEREGTFSVCTSSLQLTATLFCKLQLWSPDSGGLLFLL